MNELIHKFELPECELIVIEKEDCLHFGTYLNDMQCEDTENKLLYSDIDYVNTLMAYKEVYEKGIDELIEKYNKRFEPKGFYLDVENTMICEFIKELKKLKGE